MAIPQREILEVAAASAVHNFESMDEAREAGATTAFLSYGRYDIVLARSVEKYLRDCGWKVYVDWNASGLPEKPSGLTARLLQLAIQTNSWFLFLATESSCGKSRWCPWEIGYADKAKGKPKILIIPTSDSSGSYGSEYLELYRSIDIMMSKVAVVKEPESVSRRMSDSESDWKLLHELQWES